MMMVESSELGDVLCDAPDVETPHISVLLEPCVEAARLLADRASGIWVDLTLGFGGHAEAVLNALPNLKVIGLDRDTTALEFSRERLKAFGDRFQGFHANYSEIPAVLKHLGIDKVDGIIADLGVSSPQLDKAERGMSFRFDGPLDMRMNRDAGETASELIERLTVDELADVIFQYGEDRRSRRIARCIKQASDGGEMTTTTELRRAVVKAVGPHRVGGVDPATRTFQGIRIAVNRELDELVSILTMLPELLNENGVAAMISFHSLEDRAVKRAFQFSEIWEKTTKKPIIADEVESKGNPRSRSAKLRVARRVGVEAASAEYFAEVSPFGKAKGRR